MTAKAKVTVEGVKKALQQVQNAKKTLGQGVHEGLKDCAKFLLRKSKELVPQEIAELKNSGNWGFRGQGLQTESRTYYGTDYAVYVHERGSDQATHGEEYNIKHAEDIAKKRRYSYKGRQRTYHARRPAESFKYLEKPARENLDEFRQIVLEEIARRISK